MLQRKVVRPLFSLRPVTLRKDNIGMLATLTSALLIGGLGGLGAWAADGIEGQDWVWAQLAESAEPDLVPRGPWNATAAPAYGGLELLSPRLSDSLPLGVDAAMLPFSGLRGSLVARQDFVCDNAGWGKCPQREACAPPGAQCCGESPPESAPLTSQTHGVDIARRGEPAPYCIVR